MRLLTIFCVILANGLLIAPSSAQEKSDARTTPPACAIPIGTKLVIETMQTIDSETAKPGDNYTIQLAQPVVIDGNIVLQAGVSGKGEVIHAQRRLQFSGRSGELIVAARYLEIDGYILRLGNASVETAGEQGRGLIISGTSAVTTFLSSATKISAGTLSDAKIVSACMTREKYLESDQQVIAASGQKAITPEPVISTDLLSEPKKGLGRIVIYRVKYHYVGYGSSCKIRTESEGKELKLPNVKGNRYLVYDTTPGIHHLSVKIETTDRLSLEVEEGTTQYVLCVMSFGVFRARPNIRPSSKEEFTGNPKLKPLKLKKSGKRN